ncbi:RICIN domain-containing protein [Streptomyces sp. M19]
MAAAVAVGRRRRFALGQLPHRQRQDRQLPDRRDERRPYDGACSGDGATWSYKSLSGGEFRIVNKRTKGCLYVTTIGHPVFSFTCGSNSGQEWRSGSGGTIKNATTNGCLTVSALSVNNPTTEACDGSAAQRWTRS